MTESLRVIANKVLWTPVSPGWKAPIQGALQIAAMVARDFVGGQVTLRAGSLVYTTLLSLVPLLAVMFSVLKGFGVHKRLEPMLAELLAPIGPKSTELTATLIGFVDNLTVGVLGAVGFAMLFVTAVSLIHKVEVAFNETWRVAESRSIMQRFGNYLSAILVGPVLVFTALAITGSVANASLAERIGAVELIGTVLEVLSQIMPFVFVIAAFTLIYWLLPNTRVTIRSAFIGGIVAGVLWQAGGALFTQFVAGSTNYAAIYAGFAVGIVAMVWIYYAWLILLIGSEIAFYHQHPEERRLDGRKDLSIDATEELGLRLAAAITRPFRTGDAPPDSGHLARALNVPRRHIEPIVEALENANIVRRTDQGEFLPARALGTVRLNDVVTAVRANGSPGKDSPTDAIDEVTTALTQARARELGGRTLQDL